MYGCKSWTIKKVESQRTDAPELWCWRRLLRVPWTTRRSNLLILKEISPEYSLEGLMLKLQYFGHLMRRADSLEKTLMLGKIEGRRRRGWQRMRRLDGIINSTQGTWVWASSRRWWRTGKPGVLQSVGVAESQTRLSTSVSKSQIYTYHPILTALLCVCVSSVAQPCLTLCDPMDRSLQSPLSMRFSRQEYCSRLPCPPPEDLPNPGIEPKSPSL